MQNLTKEWKQPPVVILNRRIFAIYLFYACKIRIIRRSDKVFSSWIFLRRYFLTTKQSLQSRLQSSFIKGKLLWLLAIYMGVASYCYYEKGRWTNAPSLSIFILFQQQSWIISRVRAKFLLGNFHVKSVIFEIAMMNIFNNCIAGSLNNNYFPLNESPSIY